MIGLDAISHYNGWAMAMAGALIVMSGLTVLSLVISQLHRIVALFEKRTVESSAASVPPEGQPAEPPLPFDFPLDDLEEAADRCRQDAAQLGDVFELKALFKTLKESGWPAPHLTIRSLRDSGMLVPSGDGLFSWKR